MSPLGPTVPWMLLATVAAAASPAASTDRQLAVWRESGENLNAVVDDLIAETENLK